MAKILVVEDSADTLNLIRIKLSRAGHQVIVAADGEAALQSALEHRPQLVILDVMLPKLDGFAVARRLRKILLTRHVAILMLTARSQIADKVAGFEAGADDYITKPFDPAELELRVRTLLARIAPSLEAESAEQKGKVITVFSFRGGVGKTCLAVNLAVTLAQLWGRPMPLMDLALQNGQAAVFLGLRPKATLEDLIDHWQEYSDADLLGDFFAVKNDVVKLLAAPRHPADAERVTSEMLAHLVRIIRMRSPFVVIDTPGLLNDALLAVLDASNLILLLVAPEVASVHAAAEALEAFTALDFDKSKISLVLNRTYTRLALTPSQITSALGVDINLVVPCEPELFVQAINSGVPYVLANPNGAAARVLQDFAFSLGLPEVTDNGELSPLAKTVQARVRSKPG